MKLTKMTLLVKPKENDELKCLAQKLGITQTATMEKLIDLLPQIEKIDVDEPFYENAKGDWKLKSFNFTPEFMEKLNAYSHKSFRSLTNIMRYMILGSYKLLVGNGEE